VGYTKDLRGLSHGTGSYSIELEGYEKAPASTARALEEDYQRQRAEGR